MDTDSEWVGSGHANLRIAHFWVNKEGVFYHNGIPSEKSVFIRVHLWFNGLSPAKTQL